MIFSNPPSCHGALYVLRLPRRSALESSKALAVMTQSIFAYKLSAMLGALQIYADVCNLVSYQMCALVSCAF